jgi:tripartite motif-containing protein 71
MCLVVKELNYFARPQRVGFEWYGRQFHYPEGIGVDSRQGNVYVADTGNNRVQMFDDYCKFITEWGSPGTANGQFNSPEGITVDKLGHIYVVDRGNDRIEKFDRNGTFIAAWISGYQ